LAALRQFISPYTQMRRLQSALAASTPQLDAEQAQWEQDVARGYPWSVLKIASATARSPLMAEADGSYSATGAGPDFDAYRITATTLLRGITAIRLELLPDPRLPSGGPGCADDGSFVLSGIRAAVSSKGSAAGQIVFQHARATRETKELP